MQNLEFLMNDIFQHLSVLNSGMLLYSLNVVNNMQVTGATYMLV